MRRKRGQSNAKEQAKLLTSLVHRDKSPSVIRRAYKRDKGSTIKSVETESKTIDLVSETLLNKYSEGRDVSVDNFPMCLTISRFN